MNSILIIEDEKVIRETISEILSLSNYEVILAKDGLEGVSKAKSTYPDLVICDVMMPRMDGMETLFAFRSSPELKNIPFVFLSAMSEMKDVRKGMNSGAEDYLTKPFKPKDLLKVIDLQLNKLNDKFSEEAKNLRKDKMVIKLKKKVEKIELKWQDCLKSAGRIQNVILPKESEIAKSFPRHFNYYNPKYEVSGDFYWVQHLEHLKLIAVADCTGHGIAASLLTICCYNGLNLAVKQFGLENPARILEKVNELVNDFIQEHGGSYHEMGMDIALCAIDEKKKILTFSGARRPLYIISDKLQISSSKNTTRFTQGQSKPLFKVKGSPFSIGSLSKKFKIQEHTISYQDGDLVYLCSDGFSDQFGGISDKRFLSTNLINLLLSIQHEEIQEQHRIIAQTFNLWKNDTEQTDDVTLLGFKL